MSPRYISAVIIIAIILVFGSVVPAETTVIDEDIQEGSETELNDLKEPDTSTIVPVSGEEELNAENGNDETILLFEDFEKDVFPPGGWQADDGWYRTELEYHSGGASARVDFSMDEEYNEALWTPWIELGDDPELFFWEKSDWVDHYDEHHRVWVYDNDEEFHPLHTFSDARDYWRRRNFELDEWSGEEIRIVFQYYGDDGTNWYIDHVEMFSDTYMRVMKPIITVPQIREREDTLDIWVRNKRAEENTSWEASLYKEYTDDYYEEFEIEITDVEKADHRGRNDWYLTAEIPEVVREELYDLHVSDGTVTVESIQSVDVVDEITDQFSFVTAADPHIGYYDDGEPAAVNRFRQFIREMNLIRPDFVTLEGDISDKEPLWWATQDPYPSEQDEKVYQLLQELEVPVYTAPGNHDFSYVNDDDPDYNIRSYQEWINPHLNYTFNYGDDYLFVVQNSGKYAGLINPDGMMTMDNVTWMEDVLADNMDTTMRFIHQHHPVYPDELDDSAVRDAYLQVIEDYDVTGVLAGHVHTNRDIYDADGNEIPGDPTQGERPLHVTTGDIAKSVHEYRLVRIDGDEIESLTYDLDGDGERDDKAGIPLGGIEVNYSPENDGTNTEVVATVQNALYESFEDAIVEFTVPSPNPGYEYHVEDATIIEEIDTGQETIFYVSTDVEADTTKQVTIGLDHYIDSLPASNIGPNEATMEGWIPDIGEEVDTFFRYREYESDEWVEIPLGTMEPPRSISHDLTGLDPLQRYEFKAGVQIGEDERRIIGDTMRFVTGDLTRTTQTMQEWSSYEQMEGMEIENNEIMLEMSELDETFEFTGEMETYPTGDNTHLRVEMLGAGGGGSIQGGDWTGARGGDGGRLEAVFDISNFTELNIYVGEGGRTGDGSSSSINNPGGWGASHGGAGQEDTYTYGSPHSGAGGGSTEIVGVTEDGTEVWLAAADAGGGGGEVEDIDMVGVDDRAVAGGGGGAGGLGGSSDYMDGDDAETADQGVTPRFGTGEGGQGGDAYRDWGSDDEHAAWPGDPGGFGLNYEYLNEIIEAEIGGHRFSGGNTNYNHGEYDPFRDGQDGMISATFRDLSTSEGVRISEPMELPKRIPGPTLVYDSVITWDAVTPGESEVEIYTAVTEGEEPEEQDWIEAENGDPIPVLTEMEDVGGKYLWTKQRMIAGSPLERPILESLTESIIFLRTMDIHLYDHEESGGWNFVSFNLDLEDNDLEAILEQENYGISGNYEKVMYYDSEVDEWKSYVPDRKDRFNTFDTWDHKMGLWIRMNNYDTLTLIGMEPVESEIMLNPGWNMVGYPSSEPIIGGVPEEVTVIGYFDEYKETNIAYDDDPDGFVFEPGQGYWMYNEAGESVVWAVDY